MNLFSIPPLLTAILLATLAVIVYSKNRSSIINKVFSFECLTTFIWLFCDFIAYNSKVSSNAMFWYRIAYPGILFISIFLFHYTIIFLRIKARIIIFINRFNYLIGFFIILMILFSNLIIKDVKLYFWGYYPLAGKYHSLFLCYFFSLIAFSYSAQAFFYFFRKQEISILRRNQIKYILLAFLIFGFASFDYFANYGISLYPFGYIPTTFFITIITYSIIRYRLMDISIAITRTGIFVVTYSLVLGVPFLTAYGFRPYFIGLFGDRWWLAPMGLLTALATVGPFIYIYIDRKAEDRLLREQRRYQHALRKASGGMIRVRDLNKLLNLIVYMLTRIVKIEFATIFLFDSESGQYKMVAKRGSVNVAQDLAFTYKSSLVKHLRLKKQAIVYEELQLESHDNPRDRELAKLEKEIQDIKAAVVIPSFVGNRLLGFLVLGMKLSGKLYSQDDLNVFSVLANQAALAVENARFYQEVKETQEQLFQAEKMATIGTMADGLSHQVNNRFQTLSLIAGDSLNILENTDISQCSPEVKESLRQLKYAFERIETNVIQGGEIVRGLLRYSRPGQKGFEYVDFNKIINGAFEMVQYKVHLYELNIEKQIPSSLPKIRCNAIQLEEVFFNLIDNAYDAIKERKEILKEVGLKGKIIISAVQKDEHLVITFQDNGLGIKDKYKGKLFAPFFTTKASSRKGTGLGLYVIQKIIGFHNGTISVDSAYGVGTKFEIALPFAESDA